MAFLLALLVPLCACAASFTGKVVAVIDGDTIKVLRAGHVPAKVRLLGIDAPEKSQAFGARSKEALSRKVFGQTVTVEFRKRDQYGRILGKVLRQARDVNLAQVEEGFAWHYSHYAKDQPPGDGATYARAEMRARQAGVGLWSKANPIPPWDYRHERRIALPEHGSHLDPHRHRRADRERTVSPQDTSIF